MEKTLDKYLDTVDGDWYKQRIAQALFFLIAGFMILVARLFYLQVIEGQEFRRLSENNSIRLQTIDPPRGMIFDRKGKLLVDNRPSFDLSITRKDAKPIERTVENLSAYIGVSAEELMSKIRRNPNISSYKPILLKQDIGREALAAIEVHNLDLPGVLVYVTPRREYIKKQNAAHILGYLGEINSKELKSGKYPYSNIGDFIGKFGVERTYEHLLMGKQGGRQVEVNASGQVVRVLKTVQAQPGHAIYLTIDQQLQEKAENLLGGHVGAIVAMEPGTGNILAMASSPSFDQNAFVGRLSFKEWNELASNPFRPMENKAIQAEYPPASVFKIVTAIAGLEEGVITENSSFYCPGYYEYGDRVFHCWNKFGHGQVNVVKALTVSCDVFFYQLGQKLGIERLSRYARLLGLGAPTGVDLEHEAKGLVPTPAWKKHKLGQSWQGGETLLAAIGQSYSLATPLQMASLLSVVANEGKRYRPTILKEIISADGEAIFLGKSQTTGHLPVSPETIRVVKKGLWNVVNSSAGTAHDIRLEGVEISGKTGTAQVVGREKFNGVKTEDIPYQVRPHAWFAGYAPAGDPQIAVSVIIEHGASGSKTAAPIARDVIREYLRKGR
ncbi:MAG: penicillin-binding protein 2 [Desulfobacterales bacterium]|nr:penicillin-binding protein 2 [Desulfobacterales bacterium]